jgi:GT2 family glycosyltransferase
MITIIYSTHKDKKYNEEFKKHLLNTVALKDTQILEFENFGQYSLAEVYNKGIEMSENNIVCCIHNDIKLEKGWGKKLLQEFEKNTDYGIIGKAGSCYFPESGVYWEKMHQTMVGQVYHHPQGQKKWLNQYSASLPILIPVVTIDGLFISFDKSKIKHKFDETIGKFHFYDHGFCVPNYLDGVKIGVTSSFEITHESVGQPNEEFFESKDKFLEKYSNNLPLDLQPENVYVEKINRKPLNKKMGKVAIIIPTKGNLNLLFNCINSFYEHCDENIFNIFIADTGSTNEEINQINDFIKEKGNIRLINYDYYNFAKINNDVVKNYVTNEFEFLLFVNNDIKVLNDVIYEMLKIMKLGNNIGTIGARLHYENNLIQHDGIFVNLNLTNNTLNVSHLGLLSYYNYKNGTKEVIGSTAALLMIRKNLFNKIGMFNEKYVECFEDVELNLLCYINGYKNYCVGKAVAYHYESQTRNKNDKKIDGMKKDYYEILSPFMRKHFEKIKTKIFTTQ